MSRRYEFLDQEMAEVLTAEEVNGGEIFEETLELAADQVVLVMGNPYASAAVLVGTRDALRSQLNEYIDLLYMSRSSTSTPEGERA